jgi:hypothetical protein
MWGWLVAFILTLEVLVEFLGEGLCEFGHISDFWEGVTEITEVLSLYLKVTSA